MGSFNGIKTIFICNFCEKEMVNLKEKLKVTDAETGETYYYCNRHCLNNEKEEECEYTFDDYMCKSCRNEIDDNKEHVVIFSNLERGDEELECNLLFLFCSIKCYKKFIKKFD